MKNLYIIYFVIASLALAYSIVPALLEAPQMGSTWRKDQKFIPALQKLSKLIPENERIVSSNFDPTVYYFTGRGMEVPSNLSSQNSLLNYMEKNSLVYLLIIEGQHNVSTGYTSFDNSQISALSSHFKEIATVNTDSNKFHLYKRI